VTSDQVLLERLTAQNLAGPPLADAVAVTRRLLAVQAQDPRGFRLAIRARSAGLTVGDVDHALTEDRSLVVTWLNRGTLHLVTREDYPWLQALTAPRSLTATLRRLEQEQVPLAEADRGVAVIERTLAANGPLTRIELREHLDQADVRTQGQALIHLLSLACLRGLAVRGPVTGREHAYVLVRDWLGTEATAPVDRERALAELARRYLAGHGPADDRDLAKWAGLPLRDSRGGLRAIAHELTHRDDGLVALAGSPPAADTIPPRLLGAFEPVLLGWTTRDLLPAQHLDAVISGGIFRSFALVRGRAVATWRLQGQTVELAPFEPPLAPVDAAALEHDAHDVMRFFTGPGGGSRPGEPRR
jgi:hypothetical protein